MIQVKVDNVKYQQDLLNRYRQSLGVFKNPMEQIARLIRRGLKEQFQTEGRYGTGSKWAPLKEKTIDIRERYGFNAGPILQRLGELKRSWSEGSHPGHATHITNSSLVMGSEMTVARGGHYLASIHHYGTDKIAARPIMAVDGEIPDDLRAQIQQTIEDHLARMNALISS
jgi:phage gpG-like protein